MVGLRQRRTDTGGWITEMPEVADERPDGLSRGRLAGRPDLLVRRLRRSGGGSPEERALSLRRLGGIRDPNLFGVRGAAVADGDVHLLAEWEPGETLAALLDAHEHLDLVEVAAIGLAVLRGLAALQRAGLAYGSLDASDVLVTSAGRVKLITAGGDVRSAGALLARLLGAEAEKTAPALVVTARSLAEGAAGRSPAHALALWRDAAGMAGSESAQASARKQLAAAVRRHRSAVGRAVTELLAGSPARDQRSAPLRAPALVLTLAALALVVLGGFAVLAATHRPAPASSHSRPVHAAAPPPATATAATTPDDAVRRFFEALSARRYDAAARYCTPRLLAANPPAQLAQRYGDVSSIQLVRDQVVDVNESAGIANVAVTVSYREGSATRMLSGNLYLANGPEGWRIDRYSVS